MRISGTKSGTISTPVPNGRVKVVFTTDQSVCYASNPSIYSGITVSFSVNNNSIVDKPLQVNGNGYFSGNVGVGTLNPTSKFHVEGDVYATGALKSNNMILGAGNNQYVFSTQSWLPNNPAKVFIAPKIANTTDWDWSKQIIFDDSGSLLVSGGNIGIGTQTPQTGLHVTKVSPIGNANVAAILGDDYNHFTYFGGTTGGRIRGSNEGYLVVESNPNGSNNKSLYLNHDSPGNILMAFGGGNVGIGAEPSSAVKLEVAGEIKSYGFRVFSSNGDNVNAAPWYGLGVSNLDFGAGISNSVVQLAGYYGLNLQTGQGRIVMLNNGNIGIGTPNPIGKFDMKTAPNQHIQFVDNVNGALPGCVGIVSINDGNTDYTPMGFYASKYYFGNGNMGIGTTSPSKKLDVEIDEDYQFRLGNANGQGYNIGRNVATGYLNFYGDQSGYNGYVFGGANGTFMSILNNGKVSIGTTTPDNTPNVLLTVNGAIHAKEVLVDMNILADYVFNSDYTLMPLHKVEAFVKTNKHLPEIPSAAEVKEKGLNMGEMQNKLLQKIEELTLYVIEQQKQIEAQNAKIVKLENNTKH